MGIPIRYEGKSPYSKYHKRRYEYSEQLRACIKACREGRTDEYDRLSHRFQVRLLLSHARAGIDVSRWPGLGWTRNDARFLSERAAGHQERGSQNPLPYPATA